jgi:ferredoxin-NADP reductase
VEPPKGKFVLPEETSRPLVFVAGGIGITVFRSMLLYIREKRLPYRVTLIYSNRDPESAAFLDEMQALEGELSDFRLIVTMTDDPNWEGDRRRLDAAFFKEQLEGDLNQYTFMVAGPPEMAEAMQTELAAAGVDEANVAADSFSGY